MIQEWDLRFRVANTSAVNAYCNLYVGLFGDTLDGGGALRIGGGSGTVASCHDRDIFMFRVELRS